MNFYRKVSVVNSPPVKKLVHIETWGCQMNVNDSERMLEDLHAIHYQFTDNPRHAHLIILNTCHIREKSTHKVISRLGVLRQYKRLRPELKIVLAGCVAEAVGKKIALRLPYVDFIVGTGQLGKLPGLLTQDGGLEHRVITGFSPKQHFYNKNLKKTPNPLPNHSSVTRYLTIVSGCNNFCTFCVVPRTRGREISKPIDHLIGEAKALIVSGAKEITLIGQNVNSYGQDFHKQSSQELPFLSLLREMTCLLGLESLRFTTSNPHDFTESLAQAFLDFPKLGRHLHLPVQSGSDSVLARMRRKVTVKEYLERIFWLRKRCPQMALSTDVIVGFPGETEEDFIKTLRLVEEIRFHFIYAFKYSPRPQTLAARFSDQIPEIIKAERLRRLNQLQDKICQEIILKMFGRIVRVLFHYESRKESGAFYGRSEAFQLVKVASKENLVGKTRMIKILDGNKTALLGEEIK